MKNRITLEDVRNNIIKEEFVKLGTKMTACILTLKDEHEVIGLAGVVDASTYDIKIGGPIAKSKAIDEVFSLMGYALQVKLHEKK